jgi:perosamine synthetase
VTSSDLPAILGGTPLRPEGPPGWPRPLPEVLEALTRAMQDGSWGHYEGPHGERLREKLAELHAVDHAWLCSSGTAAVELALRGVGVQPGDEVILAAYDFKANFQDVLAVGAIPVLVDINAAGQLDSNQLEAARSPRTKAVLASHLHGAMVDMPAVRDWADEHKLAVVEDVCQMPGARIGGRAAGSWGDVGALSFGGSKLLTSGRGGAVICRSPQILERIRRFVLRGNDVSPLSELQAALLLPQINRLAEENRQRAAAVSLLRGRLADIPGLVPLQTEGVGVEPGYYKLGCWYNPHDWQGLPRDHWCAALQHEGIALFPGFRALHKIHAPRRFRAVGSLSQAARADQQLVVLHHPILLEGEPGVLQIVSGLQRIQRYAVAVRQECARRQPLMAAE